MLDLAGPVTVTFRVRGSKGGKGSMSWRTKAEKDFVADNVAVIDWPTAKDWQEMKAELPVKDRLMHLRITSAAGESGFQVQSIKLTPAKGQPVVFDFSK
jgi:hypothetical protein